LEPDPERSICLSGVRDLAVGAGQLVYSACIIFTLGLVLCSMVRRLPIVFVVSTATGYKHTD
jgi:hypothetical protein